MKDTELLFQKMNEYGVEMALYGEDGKLIGQAGNFPDFYVENDKFYSFDYPFGKGAKVVILRDDKSPTTAKLLVDVISNLRADPIGALSPAEKIKKLLLGYLTESQKHELRSTYNFHQNGYYALMLTVNKASEMQSLTSFISTFCDKEDLLVQTNDKTLVYYRIKGDEYSGASDFANVLYENIKEEIRVDLVISVAGEVHSFDNFVVSYELALTAQKFGTILYPQRHIYEFNEYALPSLLALVPRFELVKILERISDVNASVWDDSELMETAEEFIHSSLNVSETSRALYIHRNTLMYRLDKIERETGLNIKEFASAETLNLILTIRSLLRNNA